MAIDLSKEKGVPLERQTFNWQQLISLPISKLDADAFTRVRIILMNGIETEAMRFSHAMARMQGNWRLPLALVRRIEKQQQAMVNWLLPADQSTLETTVAYEQVAVEVTASLAMREPDAYVKRMLNFALLEDFDHLYRYSALMDRLEGRDANNILQSYTDIRPGRPTVDEHRDPIDDLRNPYDRKLAAGITKLNVMTIVAAENQTLDFYANVGPMYADPLARRLYAEIDSIEEQHVSHYESLLDPGETPLGMWLLHEATEIYNYAACMSEEPDQRIRQIWEQMLAWELGHLQVAMEHFQKEEARDPFEVIPRELPERGPLESHRDYINQVLKNELDLQPAGADLIPASQVQAVSPSLAYRGMVNANGSPSEIVASGYIWAPGTELTTRASELWSQEGRA
jgi:hypothetical protein